MGRIAVRVPYQSSSFNIPYPGMTLIRIVDHPMEECSFAIVDGDSLPVWKQGVHPWHVEWDVFYDQEKLEKSIKFTPKGPSQ